MNVASSALAQAERIRDDLQWHGRGLGNRATCITGVPNRLGSLVPEDNSDKELSSQSTDIHQNRRGLLIPSLAVGLVLMTLVAIALAVYCWGAASKNQKEASGQQLHCIEHGVAA